MVKQPPRYNVGHGYINEFFFILSYCPHIIFGFEKCWIFYLYKRANDIVNTY